MTGMEQNKDQALQQAIAQSEQFVAGEEEQIKSVEDSMEVLEVPDTNVKPVWGTLPFDIDSSGWPKVRLKVVRMVNFGPHKNIEIEFGAHTLHCLVGPNGYGKTTILSGIQALFGNFSGYDPSRYLAKTLRMVRDYRHLSPQEQETADFLIEGVFEIKEGNNPTREYRVGLSRQKGFTGSHPGVVRLNLPHYCFMARFDQEMHIFQIRRNRWSLFKELFEAVTGYEVEESIAMLDGVPLSQTADRRTQREINNHVQAFLVKKPRETILHKECSAGERKIAKSFSTILNKSVQPNIILIDNVTDHIELSRHLPVIAALEKCFAGSQLIVTCHSQPVQRYLSNRDRLVDLRFIHADKGVVQEPWRLRLIDEVVDAENRIQSLPAGDLHDRLIHNSKKILQMLTDFGPQRPDTEFIQKIIAIHLQNVSDIFIRDVIAHPTPSRIRGESDFSG